VSRLLRLDKEKSLKAGDTFELAFTLQKHKLRTVPEEHVGNLHIRRQSAITPVYRRVKPALYRNLAAGEDGAAKLRLMTSSALFTGTYTIKNYVGSIWGRQQQNIPKTEAAVGIPVEAAVTVVEVATPQVVVSSYNLKPGAGHRRSMI
jgi:hypothetical protein